MKLAGSIGREESFAELRAGSLALIKNLFGSEHPHYSEFLRAAGDYKTNVINHVAAECRGVLKAIRDQLERGWFRTTKSLIAAEVFSDFMEMAEYFLSEGYKDPAAVMIGGVLEEHLRQLCLSNGIEIQRIDERGKSYTIKAATMNQELQKAEVYKMTDQKLITAWQDIRNNAAHGKLDQFTIEQVRAMHMGVLEFVSRVSID